MILKLGRCFATPVRCISTTLVVVLALLVVFSYFFLRSGGASIGTFCGPPIDCPLSQGEVEATWSALLEIEQRHRNMSASATAEALDDQHTAVVETLVAHESISATRRSVTPVSLTRVPTAEPTATATMPTREPTVTEAPPTPETTATATAIPPTATPLSMPPGAEPELTPVADGQIDTATQELETPTFEPEPTVVDATVQSTVTVDTLEGYVEPCTPYPGSSKDPCERRVPWEWPSLKNPNFVADIWEPWPPFTVREWVDWKFGYWHKVPHFIVRGVAVPGSTRCASHGPDVLIKVTETDELKVGGAMTDIDCYTDIAVRQYIFGSGPSRITYRSGGRSVDELSGDFGTVERDSAYFADITSPLTKSLEGYEWIIWLTTPQDASQGAWKATSMWDVQRREDGAIVGVSRYRVGSNDESVYLDELEPALEDFVPDTKAAMAHYVELYGGKIGDSTNAPSFISSPDLSSVYEYIKLMGALDVPGFTFTPPPPSPLLPSAPTDLYGELWTDPQPEVDLAWTAPVSSQVTTYKIMRVDSLGTEIVVAEIPSEFVEVTDRHLPIAGAEYTYTVIAVNEHGESPPSGPAVIRNGAPNAPTGLYVSLEPGNEADLEWYAPPTSYVTGYRIDRKTGNGAWVTLSDNLSTDYLNSTDWNLQSGTTYTYRVVALNGWSASPPSTPFVLRVP